MHKQRFCGSAVGTAHPSIAPRHLAGPACAHWGPGLKRRV